MIRARSRALTHGDVGRNVSTIIPVEMRRARSRALTHQWIMAKSAICKVEMRRARSRALTPNNVVSPDPQLSSVEMRRARSRALTHPEGLLLSVFFASRNEKSPFKGIDTFQDNVSSLTKSLTGRNEKSPFKGIDTASFFCHIFLLGGA